MLIYSQHVLVVRLLACLVENAQHLVQPVVDLSMETRNLNDNARMCQAFHKGVRQALHHFVAIIVACLVVYVEHRFLNVPDLVAQQIDGHHRQGIAPLHIFRIGILNTKILSEPQCLGFEPRLLQLYQDQTLSAVVLAHCGTKVNAEYRQQVALLVGVFMRTHFHPDDILTQQGRENRTGDSLILHQVFEHNVVNRVSYYHTFVLCFLVIISSLSRCLPQNYTKKAERQNNLLIICSSDSKIIHLIRLRRGIGCSRNARYWCSRLLMCTRWHRRAVGPVRG